MLSKIISKVFKGVFNLVLQVVAGVAIVVAMLFATAVKAGNEQEIVPALMEEYNVDSFEELANYGHN